MPGFDKKLDKELFSKSEKNLFPFTNITFHFENKNGRVTRLATDWLKRLDPANPDIREAKILGAIFNYLQHQFPEQTCRFEMAIFMKMAKKGSPSNMSEKNF